MALDAGLEVVKFFPAEAMGGVPTLKAMSAPFSMVRFIPTGGIGPEKLLDYLGLKSVLAVGGSWMVAAKLLEAGNLAEVNRLAAEATALVGGKS